MAILETHKRARVGGLSLKFHPMILFVVVGLVVVVTIVVGFMNSRGVVDGGVVDVPKDVDKGNFFVDDYFLNDVDASDPTYTEAEMEFCNSLKSFKDRIICSESATGRLPENMK